MADLETARADVGKTGEPGERSRTALPPRAVRLLDELRRRARNGVVCERTGVLAKALDVSPDTVQRALRDLEAAGYIAATRLRDGKARAFRLLPVESPQPLVEWPQAAVIETTAAAPEGGRAAVKPSAAQSRDWRAQQARRGVSPTTAEDRAWLDAFERTPELDASVARAQQVLTDLVGAFNLRDFGPADTGRCDDCGDEQTERRWFGRVALCSGCIARRHDAAQRFARDVAAAEGA